MKPTSFESVKSINSEEEWEDEINQDTVISSLKEKKYLKMLPKGSLPWLNIVIYELGLNWL